MAEAGKRAKQNRLQFCILAGLFVATIVFHFFLKDKPEEAADRYAGLRNYRNQLTGTIAPNFKLALLNGDQFSVEDNVGRNIIVIHFLTTWDEQCSEQMQELNNFRSRYREKLIVIGIFKETRDDVEKFLARYNPQFPVGIDESGDLWKKYMVNGIATVLIGPDGKVRLYDNGPIYNSEVTLVPVYRGCIESLKKGGISREEYLRSNSLHYPHDTLESTMTETAMRIRKRR